MCSTADHRPGVVSPVTLRQLQLPMACDPHNQQVVLSCTIGAQTFGTWGASFLCVNRLIRYSWLCVVVVLFWDVPTLARPKSSRAPLKRFHLVSLALQSRLSSNSHVRRSLQAVGQLHGGSAFLVERPRSDGTALMLTAGHVVTSCQPGKTRVRFQPDGMGGVLQNGVFKRVVAQSKKLDYALVEVALPAQVRKLEPVSLASSLKSGHRLYSVGYPLLETPKYLARTAQNAHLVRTTLNGVMPVDAEKDLRTKTIVSGIDTSSGRTVVMRPRLSLFGRPLFPIGRSRLRVTANLPAIGGASGSPVFSSQTHQVRGIMTTGGAEGEVTPLQWFWAGLRGRRLRGRWRAGYTPISSVRKDLVSRLQLIDEGDRGRVQRLLSH